MPRLLELILLLVVFAVWYRLLIPQLLEAGPAWYRVVTGLFVLFPLTLARYVYAVLRTVLAGDTFVFYRGTHRVVRNSRVVCVLSEIDHTLVWQPPFLSGGGQGVVALSLVLKNGRPLRLDTSFWGDLPRVAEVVATFLGVEVVVRSGGVVHRARGLGSSRLAAPVRSI